MRARTAVTIIVVIATVWFIVSTIRLNESLVAIRFPLFQPVTLELWMVMLAAFGLGAGVILSFDVAGSARRFARERRVRRASEAHARVEELYLEGVESMAGGNFDKALARFSSVLSHEPEHVDALIKQGESLRATGRLREAADALERASRLAPEHPLALYSLSDVYLEAGADERAKLSLERIVELAPDTALSARAKLRDLFVRQLRWEEADSLQVRLVDMLTRDDERAVERQRAHGIRLGLGMSRLSKGAHAEAISMFRSILEEDARFVAAYVHLGAAQALEGDADGAVQTWKKGFDETGSVEPLVALQNFYLRNEQPEDAIGVWKNALVLSDHEVPLRYCLAKLHYRLFMLDEALREFHLIEDRVSGLPALHLFMARILESKNEHSKALAKTKLLVAEVEGLVMDYVCESCKWRASEWAERCSRCGQWGSVTLHLPAANNPEPTIQPSPTWSTP